jgi:phosphatidylserine/phosphatidylglycerophosphate/cardiolipin synthase-like enzyme
MQPHWRGRYPDMPRRRRAAKSRDWLLVLVVLVAAAIGLYLFGPEVWEPATTAVPTAPAQPATTERYSVRFTKPVIPDDKSRHQGGPDEDLVALMDKATKTLDVADYDFDLANVAAAMARAKQRGVTVRMVTDTDTIEDTKNAPVQAALAQLRRANIPIVDDQREAIMHHKFTVVDGEWLQTGSWNYTDGDTYRLSNNSISIHSVELAKNYTDEFERMFVKRQFGPQKASGATKPALAIGSVRVENYFAPKDKVATHIVDTIKQAKESVYFLAFSFTHDGIGDAIVAQANAGRKVGGVFETTGSNTKFSEFGRMKDAGLDVWQDGSPYSMHHKVIVVDEQVVIFGSFNFSDSADESNDENLLIVHDPALAKEFKAEYDRVLSLAKNPPKS